MKRYNLNKTALEPLHKRYKGSLNIDHEKKQDDQLSLKPFMRENVLGLTNIDDQLKAIGDSMLQIKRITNLHFIFTKCRGIWCLLHRNKKEHLG